MTAGANAAARRVSVCAPAKINLFLHVGDKRADGFHALESLVVFTEAGDRLSFAESDELRLEISGAFGRFAPLSGDNLVLKAARALNAPGRGALIALEKNLPVASGIGGGSADAAATLRGLNLLWDLNRSEADLSAIAAELGSDIPACLLSRPCWMAGRGEHVEKLPELPQTTLILVNPGIEVATAKVFGALETRTGVGAAQPPPAGLETLWDLDAYLNATRNDLEAPARALQPVIGDVLDALAQEDGCVVARMSGSGATCFGIFEGRWSALPAAERISHEHPDWWVRTTRIADTAIGVPHWAA